MRGRFFATTLVLVDRQVLRHRARAKHRLPECLSDAAAKYGLVRSPNEARLLGTASLAIGETINTRLQLLASFKSSFIIQTTSLGL